MTTFTTKITRLKIDNNASHENYVTEAEVKITGVREGIVPYEMYAIIPFVPGDDFVPFNELTEEVVTGWVHSTPEYVKVVALIEQQLEYVQANTKTTIEPPWTQATNTEE